MEVSRGELVAKQKEYEVDIKGEKKRQAEWQKKMNSWVGFLNTDLNKKAYS